MVMGQDKQTWIHLEWDGDQSQGKVVGGQGRQSEMTQCVFWWRDQSRGGRRLDWILL
jgi:hypothetical protein